MIQTSSIHHSQQRYSHLSLEVKKNWQAFCKEFQKTFDNQELQTQARLLLESITRASGGQIKTLDHRVEQMARKTYVNNARGLRNP